MEPEMKFNGKTRAEWLALQRRGGGLGQPTDAEINTAVWWFEERDRTEQADRQKQIIAALQKKHKPHWSQTPTFWVSVAVLIVALLSWRFPVEPKPPIQDDKLVLSRTNFVLAPTNLPPAMPVSSKTSPPAPVAIQGTNHLAN
jgi:hypothetical protein